MRIALFILAAQACWGQAEFEVASIKPNLSMGNNISINRQAGGVFSTTNSSLRMLILFAWDIRPHQLSGGPAWLDDAHYDIVARPPHDEGVLEPTGYSEASAERTRQRVRALLIDRFKLAVHTETKELPIYALVLAKNGPHLAPPSENGPSIMGRPGQLTCKKVSMKMFAERTLGQRMGRTVIDKTGLDDNFDFEVKYVEDAGAASADATGPDFLTALQEQLGLKLEPQKGPVQVIVVDHAEKASAN